MGSNIRIIGYDRAKREFSKLPETLRAEVRGVVEDGAKRFVQLAKDDAPVDVGFLKNQITYTQAIADKNHLTFEVISGAKYSPYMEFGTKTKFAPHPGTEQYAAEFKGKGASSYYDFLNDILDWVKRTGKFTGSIAPGKVTMSKKKQDVLVKEAQRVAFFIMKYGVKARPFFFRQMPKVRKELEQRLNEVLG